jgi:hypothetical protein
VTSQTEIYREAIGMSAICDTAFGLAGRRAAPLAFRPPRGLAESLAALGPAATTRLRLRQFFEALRGAHKKRPAGGGGPGEPPEAGATRFCYWDHPALWMLMIH